MANEGQRPAHQNQCALPEAMKNASTMTATVHKRAQSSCAMPEWCVIGRAIIGQLRSFNASPPTTGEFASVAAPRSLTRDPTQSKPVSIAAT